MSISGLSMVVSTLRNLQIPWRKWCEKSRGFNFNEENVLISKRFLYRNRDIPQSLTFHGWESWLVIGISLAFRQAYFEISNETMKFVFPEPGPLEGVKSRSKVILRRWAEGWGSERFFSYCYCDQNYYYSIYYILLLLLRLQKTTKIIYLKVHAGFESILCPETSKGREYRRIRVATRQPHCIFLRCSPIKA